MYSIVYGTDYNVIVQMLTYIHDGITICNYTTYIHTYIIPTYMHKHSIMYVHIITV